LPSPGEPLRETTATFCPGRVLRLPVAKRALKMSGLLMFHVKPVGDSVDRPRTTLQAMEPSPEGAALPLPTASAHLSRSGRDIPRRSRVVRGKRAGSSRRTHCGQGRTACVLFALGLIPLLGFSANLAEISRGSRGIRGPLNRQFYKTGGILPVTVKVTRIASE
jgi:hypothetical protein